ncbi:rCG63684 [Rattus norvegicus]|uniref:RCG63684 n=1 Tax=Rattus norvegicus TaxID=10116 RepID=A6HQQ2_RAT|nr:rCG63684 [Rattus norvegicus]
MERLSWRGMGGAQEELVDCGGLNLSHRLERTKLLKCQPSVDLQRKIEENSAWFVDKGLRSVRTICLSLA